jgi:hypothetical protein
MLLPGDVPPMNMGEKGGWVHRINGADAVYVAKMRCSNINGRTACNTRLAHFGRRRGT